MRAETRIVAAAAAVALIALVIRLLVIITAPSVAALDTGDYALYDIGARHFLQHGDFSNSLFLVRPPVYPLLLAALGADRLAAALLNAAMGALTAGLTVVFARQIQLPPVLAVTAGLIVALDPAQVRFTAFLGPEALANLLLLLALIAFATSFRQRLGPGFALLAGALLARSTLTRPATQWLWLLLLGIHLISARHHMRRALLPAALFSLAAVFPVELWAQHNSAVFGYRTVSTVAPYTMLYYRAASVENLAGDYVDTAALFTVLNQRVEARLGRSTAGVDEGFRHGYLAATPAVAAALNAVSFEIFTAHPLLYIATIPLAFARFYTLLPQPLTPENVLISLWNWGLLALAVLGLWRLARARHWLLLCVLGGVLAYYTAGSILVKSAGMDGREHTMLTPILALLAALALTTLQGRQHRRSLRETTDHVKNP